VAKDDSELDLAFDFDLASALVSAANVQAAGSRRQRQRRL
jgi:hypothetical protein